MLSQYDLKLVLDSVKQRIRLDYSTNLRQFLEFREEEEKTIDKTNQFHHSLLRYVQDIFDDRARTIRTRQKGAYYLGVK